MYLGTERAGQNYADLGDRTGVKLTMMFRKYAVSGPILPSYSLPSPILFRLWSDLRKVGLPLAYSHGMLATDFKRLGKMAIVWVLAGFRLRLVVATDIRFH